MSYTYSFYILFRRFVQNRLISDSPSVRTKCMTVSPTPLALPQIESSVQSSSQAICIAALTSLRALESTAICSHLYGRQPAPSVWPCRLYSRCAEPAVWQLLWPSVWKELQWPSVSPNDGNSINREPPALFIRNNRHLLYGRSLHQQAPSLPCREAASAESPRGFEGGLMGAHCISVRRVSINRMPSVSGSPLYEEPCLFGSLLYQSALYSEIQRLSINREPRFISCPLYEEIPAGGWPAAPVFRNGCLSISLSPYSVGPQGPAAGGLMENSHQSTGADKNIGYFHMNILGV